MLETWYVLEDNSVGDPREIALDKTGKLRHRDGRSVDYAPHGPRSRSVDADAERAKGVAPKAKPILDPDGNAPSDHAPIDAKAKAMKPEGPKRGYQTRESKAD